MYHVKLINGQAFEHPLSKLVCVGRNYAEHAIELNNPVPDSPILFIKPETSAIDMQGGFSIPDSDCHYETELAILIGSELCNASAEQVSNSIAGIGLALDLTKRALQSTLKEKSHPWEIAKAFDGACPLSQFIPLTSFEGIEQVRFSLSINDEPKQNGDSRDMLNPVVPLIAYMSKIFTLRPGDVILTGTPKGVGELKKQMKLGFELLTFPDKGRLQFTTQTT